MNHPVTVLLFNRPEETRRTLESLRDQSLEVPQHLLTLSVDGYPGSRDEAAGRADRTAEVADIARELFPHANLVIHGENLGIARHFHQVEERSFEDSTVRWALFFEDDYVLAHDYVENLAHVISRVDHDERVAVVSATGDSWGNRCRGEDSLYPMNHAWAFALRRSHHLERQDLLSTYLGLIDDCRYFERDFDRITSGMADVGVLTLGTSQDYVKQAIRVLLGRLALTTGRAHGHYIGVNGEHFTPEIFSELGYDRQPAPSSEMTRLPHITEDFVSALLAEQRAMVAHESLSLARGRMNSVIAATQADLASLRDAHEEQVKTLCHRIASIESEIRDAHDRLAAVYASTSWKVTKPLRNVRKVVPY